jgi:segregation and condensation protein B
MNGDPGDDQADPEVASDRPGERPEAADPDANSFAADGAGGGAADDALSENSGASKNLSAPENPRVANDTAELTSGPVHAVAQSPVPPPLREPDETALRLAEAAVFASQTPMTARALSQLLPDDMDAAAVIMGLRVRYQGRGIELVEIGGGLQFRTAADLAPFLRKVAQVPRRLPRVALETLAIVAYHQPVTRPEIEDMRGTGLSQQTLDVLLENDLIVARGRKDTPGRPTLWGTTPKFLEYFGMRDIRELPRRQDLLLETLRPEEKRPEGKAAADDQAGEASVPAAELDPPETSSG